MRLGLSCGFWGMGRDSDNLALVDRAEQLGYEVVWASEAYGPDAATVLAWIGARTQQIGLGAGVLQIPGRTPAMTAMTAASLDSLSGGRFRLGLGVSGPQVSEGWHGVPFAKPLGRTREYASIVRTALARRAVEHHGEHFTLPLPDGPGKALRLNVLPSRTSVPLYLAAVGPRNLELAGEIADGWLGVFVSPDYLGEQLAAIGRGRKARAGRHGTPADGPATGHDEPFAIDATVPVAVGDDVSRCAATVAPYAALYVGGMGSRSQNFYNQLAVRMGYEQEAAKVQDLYLAKQWRDAAAAVPEAFVDDTSLLGPAGRLASRMQRYADAGVSTLTVAPWGDDLAARMASLEAAAEAIDRAKTT
ncbi:MAG: LLM class F420-dependent oxidoreductase [Actinobacteria bacterium]|nr:LLM class F420-dependent oxidoreductase [Actinomycetota bacterium]